MTLARNIAVLIGSWHRVLRRLAIALFASASFIAIPVTAQPYPSKPIRFIIPFSPGGPTDIMGRLAAQRLTEAWSVQVVADNRAGAGGNIGTDICAKSSETKEKLLTLGGIAGGNTPEEFTAFLKTDVERWAKVAKAAKVRLD